MFNSCIYGHLLFYFISPFCSLFLFLPFFFSFGLSYFIFYSISFWIISVSLNNTNFHLFGVPLGFGSFLIFFWMTFLMIPLLPSISFLAHQYSYSYSHKYVHRCINIYMYTCLWICFYLPLLRSYVITCIQIWDFCIIVELTLLIIKCSSLCLVTILHLKSTLSYSNITTQLSCIVKEQSIFIICFNNLH